MIRRSGLAVISCCLALPVPGRAEVVFQTLTDPLFAERLPGADGLLGTADDVSAAGLNVEGTASYAEFDGISAAVDPSGVLQTFLQGTLTSDHFPKPVEGEIVVRSFEIAFFNEQSNGLASSSALAAGQAHELSVRLTGPLAASYTLRTCLVADSSLCLDGDLSLTGFILPRGVNPTALAGIDSVLASYLGLLATLAPPDWTAISVTLNPSTPMTAESVRGSLAPFLIGGTARGATVLFTRDAISRQEAFLGVAAPADATFSGSDLIAANGDLNRSGTPGVAPFHPVLGTPTEGGFAVARLAGGAAGPDRVGLTFTDGAIGAGQLRPNGPRNPDPDTGWPRVHTATGSCVDGSQPPCLPPDGTFGAANRETFDALCEWSVGFSDFDFSRCVLDLLSSKVKPPAAVGLFSISQLVSGVLAGGGTANTVIVQGSGLPGFGGIVLMPLVRLSKDVNDLSNGGTTCVDESQPSLFQPGAPPPECGSGGAGFLALLRGEALGLHLTPEQEALLGCGPFLGTNCDDSGAALLNTEASALLQSFIGIEGTNANWRTDDASQPQPGTVGFVGGPVCTFGALLANPNNAGVGEKLPGCRGPGDSGYNVAVDGDPGQILVNVPPSWGPPGVLIDPSAPNSRGKHPLTGQPWQSEMAALSWNFQMQLVTQSPEFKFQLVEEFNNAPALDRVARVQARAYSVTPGECSFLQPQHCSAIQAYWSYTRIGLSAVSEGGNGTFGLRRWLWETGGAYTVDIATGRYSSLAGKPLYALGPSFPDGDAGNVEIAVLVPEPGAPLQVAVALAAIAAISCARRSKIGSINRTNDQQVA